MALDERARTELLATFQTELGEHCQALNRAFLSLEKDPGDADARKLLEQAFRSAHSLKGAARVVGLGAVEAIAHRLEDVLSLVKQDDLELSPELFDLLYAAVDALGDEQRVGGESAGPESSVGQLLQRLEEVRTVAPALPPASVATAPPSERGLASVPTAVQAPVRAPAQPPARVAVPRSSLSPSSADETVRMPVARLDELLEQLGELVVPRLEVDEALGALTQLRERVDVWQRDWRKIRPLLRQMERDGALNRLRAVGRFLEHNEASLIALGSELGALHARFAGPSAQFRVLTDELQLEVKRLRMLPFGNLAEGFERAVRDLARSLGKEARLIVVGAETELDRRMLDEMKDPILHLLRNAIDHGIEPPDERRRRGKPSIGKVVITAVQRGAAIVLEVEDDGGGMDAPAIGRAVMERGLVSDSELEALGQDDLLRLIFLPGFSSRANVSEVSGRGVGLDVVARAVERIDGRVEVTSTPGAGTRFSVTLPLTLATARAILVEAGGSLYALPTISVERILRPARLGSVGGRYVLEHEGEAVPAVSLSGLLNLRVERAELDPSSPGVVALIRSGIRHVGIQIDRLLGEQEIVVKPLGHPIERVRFFSAATILGSGQVVPILNPSDLVRAALRMGPNAAPPSLAEPERRRVRVLIADDSLTTRSLERFILEAAGYEVMLAGDGAEAFTLLQERGCDLLVSDVDMPEMDGFALTARLRQDPRFRQLPVVLVTSLDSPRDRERGLQAGADAYIVKSGFDQEHVLRTVRELV